MALLLFAAGCGEPSGERGASAAESLVVVREVTVGRAVDGEGAVRAVADSFAPGDTVFVSLVVEGDVERAVVGARWTRGEILVAEEQQVFPLSGRMTTTFRLANPAGLPAGEYRVAIHLGEDAVAAEPFRIAAPGGGPEGSVGADEEEGSGP